MSNWLFKHDLNASKNNITIWICLSLIEITFKISQFGVWVYDKKWSHVGFI